MDDKPAVPLLAVDDLAVHFPVRLGLGQPKRQLKAVDGVTFDLRPGECLGLVGESGCGKSTLALAIMGLVAPTHGTIRLDGQSIAASSRADRLAMARMIQMVFQDPYASLNPRQTVRRTLEDPLRLHGVTDKDEVKARTAEMLASVGLRPEHADRYPHEFSGGQRQRIGIARALILKPKVVICDEPVSALDVSIRAQIINLLLDLKDKLGLSYIMISHDLGVVEHMSDRVAVMYLGRLVETGGWREIFEAPGHPYTRALISAIPDPFEHDPQTRLAKARGEVPSALNPPSGCHFHPRCAQKQDKCSAQEPHLESIGPAHYAACHFAQREQAIAQ
jgi:oligopeptide/dipeptide ABC transporter ATP-binding protein